MATTNNGNTTQQGGGMTVGSGENTTRPNINTSPNRVTPNIVTPNTSSLYKILGTKTPYTGMVVDLSGQLYTTVGGAYEGTSLPVILINNPEDDKKIKPAIRNSRLNSNTTEEISRRAGGTVPTPPNGNTTPGGPRNNRMNQGGGTGGSSY